MPFFSIILPTYNRITTLADALQSVVNQTFNEWELIVVDDGGNDESRSIVENFIKQNHNIYYYRIKHGGHVKAKNHGIKLAKSKYITFLDSDDEYKPDYLDVYYKILMDADVDLLYSLTEIVGDKYVEDFFNPGKLIHIDNCTVGGTFCIKKEVIEQVGLFPNLEYGDDTAFFNSVKDANLKIYKSEQRNYVYKRNNEDSITKKKLKI